LSSASRLSEPPARGGGRCRREHFERAGFADDVVGAGLERPDCRGRIGPANDEQHRHVAMTDVLAEHPDEFDTAGAGQL
jgi:hypothetical protein